MPTKRQLEIFLAAAEATSFRAAAEVLGISQASVSKQIDALESAVGELVFERRRGSRAELSATGIALQRDARQMLRLQHRWDGARTPAEPTDQQIVYTRSFLLETTIKPRLDDLVSRGLPRLTRFVVVDDSDEMFWRIRKDKDRSSIGLLRAVRLPASAAIRIVTIRRDACSLYVSPALAARLAAGDLKHTDLTVLLPLQGTQPSDSLRQQLLDAGFAERQFRYAGQFNELLINAAVASQGAVVLMDEHARDIVARGALVGIFPLSHLNLIIVGHSESRPERFQSLVDAFAAI
jgi:DNA-binding transcriptional LysR family regulator